MLGVQSPPPPFSLSLTHTHTTIEQDELVAVATLQRMLQDVLQGPEEEQNLLSALRLPKTSAALLGHVVQRQQRRRILHHTLMDLLTHKHT